MKTCPVFVLSVLLFCGCATGRLHYESKDIFAVVSEVLGLPAKLDKLATTQNLEILKARFPAGMTRAELWQEAIRIRRSHLYATAIATDPDKDDFSLLVFRYERDERLPMKTSFIIRFGFQDGKLGSVSYWQSAGTY